MDALLRGTRGGAGGDAGALGADGLGRAAAGASGCGGGGGGLGQGHAGAAHRGRFGCDARPRRGRDAAADWLLLLLEDDLDFAPHLRAALAAWPPLREPRGVLATLYNPHLPAAEIPSFSHEPGKDGRDGKNGNEGKATWFGTVPATLTGAQALLVRPADAARALAAWDSEGGMQSARLARLLTAQGGHICGHRPSLVQHVAADSAWGARRHTAPDFAGG